MPLLALVIAEADMCAMLALMALVVFIAAEITCSDMAVVIAGDMCAMLAIDGDLDRCWR